MHRDPPLALDPRFTHVVRQGDEVVLVGEDHFSLFREAVVGDAVSLADGRRTAIDIVRALHEKHRPEDVHLALMLLEDQDIIRSVEEVLPPDAAKAGSLESRLAAQLLDAWRASGESDGAVAVPVGEVPGGVTLVLTEDYLDPRTTDVLKGVLERTNAPSLMARLGVRGVWVGPLFRPDSSPCVTCLQSRLQLNFPARTLVHRERAADARYHVVSRAREIPLWAFEAVANQLRKEAGVEAFEYVLRSVSRDGSSDGDHPFAPLPQCADCGDPRLTLPGADVRLASRQKAGGSGGGFRIVRPEETLRAVTPMLGPITGVARSIRRITVDGCESVHVYSANHAHHFGGARFSDLREEVRDHSGGKGWTDLDARVSAICESLERASSVHRGDEPSRVAKLSELGPEAVAPNDLLHFSERQLRDRSAWNEEHGGGFQWIPEAYGDEAIEWSPVRALTTEAIRWVPSAFIYYGFPGGGARFCDGDSNGLASGNCIEEAVLQGLLEVVERDAVALWWYNRAERPGIVLPTSDDAWCGEVVTHYRALGRDVWALDVTSDVGIPVVVAVSAQDGRDVIFGFGAHLDARVALRRAITEVNQMLPSVVMGPEERQAKLGRDFPDALDWWDGHTLETDPYLCPGDGLPSGHSDDCQASVSEDLKEDVLECIARVESVGCEVLVHDLTRPDIRFPVAKVIVPGLRHFWRRLGPGRLYDVPVEMGWRSHAASELEMNPVSLFV